MQPLMTVLLTLADGTSIVTEGIWENRFRYVDELIRMGANIQVDGQVAVIEGVKKLYPPCCCALGIFAGRRGTVMAALLRPAAGIGWWKSRCHPSGNAAPRISDGYAALMIVTLSDGTAL